VHGLAPELSLGWRLHPFESSGKKNGEKSRHERRKDHYLEPHTRGAEK